MVQESPGEYIKMKFQYDDWGHQTEVASYDRSGNLIRKTVAQYQYDANGNWTEEKDFYWDATLGSTPPKLNTVRRKNITYY